jgi:ABC-type sugar transport system ATPase subunit
MDVRLERLSKSFGRTEAVKAVDLAVADRQFVTLLGPSGCGKTTLLRMIAGLESITAGNLYFGEERVNHLRPAQRNVAMVFQNYALYPNMNVAGNIGYGLRVRGLPRPEIRAKVQRVAEILEIGHLLDRKPRQLSGGQRQRVALGRAMVRDPSIFLMDEPLSNLDARLRVTMRSELKRFHLDLQTTTIYVTHDQLEAMTMSDRIAVMREGVVQQYDTPEVIYNHPANLFVASFIGSPPMNFVQVRLVRRGTLHLELEGRQLQVPQRLQKGLADMPGGEALTLGIRPQDVHLAGPEGDGCVPVRVELVELLGSEKLVELVTAGGARLNAQIRAEVEVQPGEPLFARLDPARTHLFDRDSEAALA